MKNVLLLFWRFGDNSFLITNSNYATAEALSSCFIPILSQTAITCPICIAYSVPAKPQQAKLNSRVTSSSFLLFALSFNTKVANWCFCSLLTFAVGKLSMFTMDESHCLKLSKYFLFNANSMFESKQPRLATNSHQLPRNQRNYATWMYFSILGNGRNGAK